MQWLTEGWRWFSESYFWTWFSTASRSDQITFVLMVLVIVGAQYWFFRTFFPDGWTFRWPYRR